MRRAQSCHHHLLHFPSSSPSVGSVAAEAPRADMKWGALEASVLPGMWGGCARFSRHGCVWATRAFCQPLKYRLSELATKNSNSLSTCCCCSQRHHTERGGLTAPTSTADLQNFCSGFQNRNHFIMLFRAADSLVLLVESVAERPFS